ncbi:MAG: hypothetical protein JWM98_1769 [Thermoleophilia bacterium]|nr:hypothetical protein [Thermoleophilia bacterium]
MHIEPVMPHFEYLTVRRTGGILGVDQTLHVDGNLTGRVSDRGLGDRALNLDAFTSQELMTAVSTLIARNPGASTRRGFDLFHYDIEVASDGKVYRFSTVELGADEALHGVMLASDRLIANDPDPFHTMTLHTIAPEATAPAFA